MQGATGRGCSSRHSCELLLGRRTVNWTIEPDVHVSTIDVRKHEGVCAGYALERQHIQLYFALQSAV